MTHPLRHFLWTLGLLAATAAVAAAAGNRTLRRRLLFALLLLGCAALMHLAILEAPDVDFIRDDGWRIEGLLIASGAISAFVALVFNPRFREKAAEGAPAIVQDAILSVLVVIAATFIFQSSSLFVGITGSAIVVGLALQDTLGNAFSGLAIQVERPFRVGHWVSVAGFEGRIVEVTWRATKIRTKSGNLISVPNSMIGREAITNYSEPAAPTRLTLEVGASYSAAPNDVRAAILAAIRQAPHVIETPKPDVLLYDFAGSAVTYRARFWIDDFEKDEIAKSEVRGAIYYEFSRRRIEIPFPIQVEYAREFTEESADDRTARFAQIIARTSDLSTLLPEEQRALAAAATERVFGDGEVIVREGESGDSMFIVCGGQVIVSIGEGREVARTAAGGYFGEMSLLTGEPRSAAVRANGDCRVLEIDASYFRDYVMTHPDVIERLADVATKRRQQLDSTRAAAQPAAEARLSLVAKIRQFFSSAGA